MTEPAVMPAPEPVGVCRICACTSAAPCRLPNGDECGWTTARQDLCTKDSCVRAAAKKQRQARRARRDEVRALVRPILERIRATREERKKKRYGRRRAA